MSAVIETLDAPASAFHRHLEHQQTVLEDLHAAERLLARYFGPTTTVRQEIAKMMRRYQG